MKLTVQAITASEAAYMLRRELGPVRAWDAALEEMRRDGTKTYLGLRLDPYGKRRAHGCKRPVYLRDNVDEFIRAARGVAPHTTPASDIATFDVEIDTAIVCPWRALTLTTKPTSTTH
ncbi:hypothetical protein [Burkholderia diffusa]|uniref:hypothetical protein n=1 Tax=Burkholderia diffusa TaxID=488732 RepID=UPI0007565B26|nr:hypothetical protein [Burkholderia diffusa]KVH47348.1 hypothetical protein WJ39_15665 [Burkholderia diffusa]